MAVGRCPSSSVGRHTRAPPSYPAVTNDTRRPRGRRTLAAPSYSPARCRTAPGTWHLAIVALFLKEGSGLGVLAGCRHREPYQKVVVLTNYATPEIRRRAAELGADAVFDKATELDALLDYCTEQTTNILTEEVQAMQREAIALHNQATPIREAAHWFVR